MVRGAAVLADNVAKGSCLTKSGPALPHPDSRKGRHIHRTFLRGRTRSEEASGRNLSHVAKACAEILLPSMKKPLQIKDLQGFSNNSGRVSFTSRLETLINAGFFAIHFFKYQQKYQQIQGVCRSGNGCRAAIAWPCTGCNALPARIAAIDSPSPAAPSRHLSRLGGRRILRSTRLSFLTR